MVEKYLVIYPSGKLAWANLERKPQYDDIYNGEEALDAAEIKKIIGCEWLEQVYTNVPNVVMMIDDIGKFQSPPKPHNELASQLYNGWNPMRIDNIVGTAVLFALRPTGPLQELDIFPLSLMELVHVCDKMHINCFDLLDKEDLTNE